MCGINGHVRCANTRSGPRLIDQMNDATRHRGSDYTGVFEDDAVALGHNLLAIRGDARASRQPYAKESSPWVLLFNGQIYNTDQLKKELPAAYANTELDTALLYAAVERYGWNFIEHIQGMFAIALYNKDEKIIRLYRDPSGQKLLYYYAKGDSFIFSSEIKGILEDTAVDPTIDREALTIASVLGFIPGTKTLFKHIAKVDVSEVVTYRVHQGLLEHSFYKSAAAEKYYSGTFDTALEQLVREHLQSKRGAAINLSGGLDSSLLAYEIARIGYPVHSYTTRFDVDAERYNRDADLAKRLARDYGFSHTEFCITKKEYMNNFIQSYQAIEEPRHNISIPIYHLTAKHEGINGDGNRVILSGDGGDEVFGGYPHYARNIRDEALMQKYTPLVFNLVRNFKNNSWGLDFRTPQDRWYFYKYFKFSKQLRLEGCPPADIVPPYLREASIDFIDAYGVKSDWVYECMLMDRIIWLAGENFIRSDKLYMSQSVEMRSPFAYHPFRLYVDNLLTTKSYVDAKGGNKLFLRQWAKGKLPAYITERRDKTGWRAPAHLWYDKQMKEFFLGIISDAKQQSCGLVDWAALQQEVEKGGEWPARNAHFFVSLAALSQRFDLCL